MGTATVDNRRLYGHAPENNYLKHTRGIASWMFTLDHKRIGVMYLVGVTVTFLLGGFFALVLRSELFTPNKMFLTEAQYNQAFTLHGAIMVFAFIIPAIPGSIGNFVLPVMLGAKDVAFPRLNLSSFYLWVIGTFFLLVAMIAGGLDTGWTFYTPYSIQTPTNVVAATFGAFILGFSSIFTGLNFIVTINTMRPPGMTWFKMPLFLWGMYSTSIIQVLATPVLGITLLLLIAEKLLGLGIFNPAQGGDPVLFQHFFWFYSHPAVYIMILPGMAIISEVISTHSHKKVFGYTFVALSSVAIALLSFLVWGHHMFTSGQSSISIVIFSALTFSVAIPSAVKVYNWLATMFRGEVVLTTPMCFALAFLFLFGIGGLTGLFLGTLSTDVHLHDTYFVVAHFHYVMMGSTAVAFFAGVFHWWPKMFGRMYNETMGRITCLIVFVGFNLAFLPQFVMGSRGMPRRYARYDEVFQIWHQLSTIGALVLGLGILLGIVVLVRSLFNGKRVSGNPWGASTLEWQTTSPPHFHNFEFDPYVGGLYDYKGVKYDESVEGYVPIIPPGVAAPGSAPVPQTAH
ncbi:MAG: cbb3-type cytochrome c oxidase subunit I [Pirellulaceae bacterium]|nr:cbb3-type cytochrome c oxidase subunit I [Planctomycetales bacterium]